MVAAVECAKAGSRSSTGSIAFTSDRKADIDGIPNLYRMYADGSNETSLTSDLLFNIEPDWFPNGEDRPQQLSLSARHSRRLL
jgi:Tol biopolymer transport system component